jgi:hypothetical protein
MKMICAVVAALALVSPAAAQTTPATAQVPAAKTAPTSQPATPNATTPPIDAGAPLAGANSFTETQARTRIEQLGYTNVIGLAKDANGIWRGKANKDGTTHDVSVDFRGNIVVGLK